MVNHSLKSKTRHIKKLQQRFILHEQVVEVAVANGQVGFEIVVPNPFSKPDRG